MYKVLLALLTVRPCNLLFIDYIFVGHGLTGPNILIYDLTQ